jgi:hypothetical protein
VREAPEPFVSKLFRKGYTKRLLRTDPLKAMVIGAFVRGLSVRDVESLCEEARAREDVEVDRGQDLRGAPRALRSVLSSRPLRDQASRLVPRRDLPASSSQRPDGGRDVRLGIHRRRRTCAGFGASGSARGQGGLARARPRPHSPWACRFNYWSALNEATGVKDGKLRLQVLISDLQHAGYDAARP